METKTSFVRANGVVVLNTVTHIVLHIAFVVHPCYTELNEAIWNTQALDEIVFLKLGVLVILFLDGRKYLTYGLDILRLIRESLFQILYNL